MSLFYWHPSILLFTCTAATSLHTNVEQNLFSTVLTLKANANALTKLSFSADMHGFVRSTHPLRSTALSSRWCRLEMPSPAGSHTRTCRAAEHSVKSSKYLQSHCIAVVRILDMCFRLRSFGLWCTFRVSLNKAPGFMTKNSTIRLQVTT